ncbi:MAG TPA: YiiX/YebB-like N1pC/P60 family cysteine hydrolase [Desulfopila sp.]|nr:YiiX/YebB-like N1pC/P60 family cysteine hydrolase [Desulfopila sp.]
MKILKKIGAGLAHFLSAPREGNARIATSAASLLTGCLRPGDVLLVEGSSIFSTSIKYLTQSSWSHAALYVGDIIPVKGEGDEQPVLVEADINEGVRAVGLSLYSSVHTRICRPVGLTSDEIDAVVQYAVTRLGHQYDLQNIIDLVKYLLPTPPVPSRFRRRLLALGSGDPTRAICSSLIAQAFQSIHYPILPEVSVRKIDDSSCRACSRELLHIRHHSLFAPRDFDVSPYFQIVKPALEGGFDPHSLFWSGRDPVHMARSSGS